MEFLVRFAAARLEPRRVDDVARFNDLSAMLNSLAAHETADPAVRTLRYRQATPMTEPRMLPSNTLLSRLLCSIPARITSVRGTRLFHGSSENSKCVYALAFLAVKMALPLDKFN